MDKNLIPSKVILKRVKLFSTLPEEVQDKIAAAAVRRHFYANQVIYLEGDQAEAVYILESGWVKAIRMTTQGREQAMLFLRPGEIFGDVAVFTNTPYPCTVMALEKANVWVLDAETIKNLVTQNPTLALALIRRLGERILHYISLVEDLSLRSVEERLASTLLRHAEERDGQLVVLRRHWTTFNEMAVRLGTVRDVLSRALKTLEAEGLLRVEKQEIVLLAGFFPMIPAADSGLPTPTLWVFLLAAIMWFGMLLIGGVDKKIIGLTFAAGLAYVLTFIDGVAPISKFQTTFQAPTDFVSNPNTFWNGMYMMSQQVNWWGAAAWAIFIFAALKRKSWAVPVGIFAGTMSMIGGYPMGIHNVMEVQRFSMFLPAPIISTILLVILLLPGTQKLLATGESESA